MAQVLVLYNTPADPAAFERYYHQTHIPLAQKIPGLRSYVISNGPVQALAGIAPHLVAILHFDSLADLNAALASPEGQAAAVAREDSESALHSGDRHTVRLQHDAVRQGWFIPFAETVEVVQSQEAVASPQTQNISSLWNYNYTKVSWPVPWVRLKRESRNTSKGNKP
jgi:uncharacterized protein (TIGR02118 family)